MRAFVLVSAAVLMLGAPVVSNAQTGDGLSSSPPNRSTGPTIPDVAPSDHIVVSPNIAAAPPPGTGVPVNPAESNGATDPKPGAIR
jgi:hypothetical protein